jgi:hypothetical protein
VTVSQCLRVREIASSTWTFVLPARPISFASPACSNPNNRSAFFTTGLSDCTGFWLNDMQHQTLASESGINRKTHSTEHKVMPQTTCFHYRSWSVRSPEKKCYELKQIIIQGFCNCVPTNKKTLRNYF